MHRITLLAAAFALSVTSMSRASLTSIEYGFYPSGSPDPVGTIEFDFAPVESSGGWVLPFTFNLDPNIVSFHFDFGNVGGPIVNLGQFNNLFPIPGDPIISFTGLEIDSGMLIGDSNLDQGQWGMSDISGFDQARWITNSGSTPTMLGDWHELPEPATLTLLSMGGLAILRRRR